MNKISCNSILSLTSCIRCPLDIPNLRPFRLEYPIYIPTCRRDGELRRAVPIDARRLSPATFGGTCQEFSGGPLLGANPRGMPSKVLIFVMKSSRTC